MSYDVIVVGAGAAGLFCAVNVAEKRRGAKILVLEGSRHVLAKVKISGGGRCNVTHHQINPSKLVAQYPRSHPAFKANLKRFGPKQVIGWFASHGVALKTEADGRMFPTTDQSQTIIDCLRRVASQYGVAIETQSPVAAVHRTQAGFELNTASQLYRARSVVLATGGSPSGYRLAAQLGHALVPPSPSLFTFQVDEPALTAMAGLSVPEVKATLSIEEADSTPPASLTQTGPLLVTHWGLSGPVVLRLSAWGARLLQASGYQATLLIDWFPDLHVEALRQHLLDQKTEEPYRQVKNWQVGVNSILPRRLWEYLLRTSALLPLEQVSMETANKPLNRLSVLLKAWPIAVSGKGPFKEEFVTAGGVSLDELAPATYESLYCPGLYVVGELLNIDGVTGGFNFQNAWTSGYLAACQLAQLDLSAK